MKNMSAGPAVDLCVLNVSVTGSSMLFLIEEQKIVVKVLKDKHRVRKQ